MIIYGIIIKIICTSNRLLTQCVFFLLSELSPSLEFVSFENIIMLVNKIPQKYLS